MCIDLEHGFIQRGGGIKRFWLAFSKYDGLLAYVCVCIQSSDIVNSKDIRFVENSLGKQKKREKYPMIDKKTGETHRSKTVIEHFLKFLYKQKLVAISHKTILLCRHFVSLRVTKYLRPGKH